MTPAVGTVLLTGNGPSRRMVDGPFVRAAIKDRGKERLLRFEDGTTSPGRLPAVLEVQRLIRFMPKPVITVVPGWAVGGGHSLHVVCDLTIASREHASRPRSTTLDTA